MEKQAEVLFPLIDPDKFQNITGDHELKKGSTKHRDMTKVDTVMLHQTAVRLGLDPRRYHNVACHCAVLHDGTILYVNDLRHSVWHGHGWNSRSIGIEIDGHFAGIEGDKKTIWQGGGGKVHEVTKEQIEGVKNLLIWLVGQSVALGGGFTRLVAHRQGSSNRQGDPGSIVWNAIAPWARQELTLQTPWWETLGSGMYLPRQWEVGSFFDWHGAFDRTGIGMLQIICNMRNQAGLDTDGRIGPKTKAGIGELHNSFGMKGQRHLTNTSLERIVATSEYQDLAGWLDRIVKAHQVPHHLRGNDLFDALENYPHEPGGTGKVEEDEAVDPE